MTLNINLKFKDLSNIFIFQCLSLSCAPRTYQQSHALQAIALLILVGNLGFDWVVNFHVSEIAAMLEQRRFRLNWTHISSLEKVHDIGINWNAIRITFFEFAIFSTVCIAFLFSGTLLSLRVCEEKSPYQKFLVWFSLFFNDLPQCIATAIITFAADDVYIPYFCSTLLGVIGNYTMFVALYNTNTLHYPKVIWCHIALTVICLVVQVALISKAHLT